MGKNGFFSGCAIKQGETKYVDLERNDLPVGGREDKS